MINISEILVDDQKNDNMNLKIFQHGESFDEET